MRQLYGPVWLDGRVEAIIVAGGRGTRLRPLTVSAPKHLLPVAGVPFVVHQLAKLAEAGVTRVVLATSFFAEQFEPELGDGSRWGLELVYVTETEPLGTAGAIRNVADQLRSGAQDPVVVVNGDVLSSHDLRGQVTHHCGSAAAVTLHLVEVPDARAFGCVPTDAEARVTAFLEKSPDPVSHQINAGCYVFTRSVIDEIPTGRVVSVERETFPSLLAMDRVLFGYVDRSYWADVGTPAALCQTSSDVVRGIARTPAYAHPGGVRYVEPSAVVGVGAVVRGGSAVGAGVVVGDGAVVEGSVVAAGARIGPGSQVVDSVVGPAAELGADVRLRDAVVGDGASIGAGCELLAGARVWNNVRVPAGAIRFSSDV